MSICWTCREAVQGPVCVSCGALQPPPPEPDPFVVLGLERRFHVDKKAVEERFRAVSRQVHPDKWAGKKALLRRMSLQWTAAVNTARRVLLDDEQRARYLATGEAMPKETGGPPTDQAFLMEVFEWQMEAEQDPGAVATRAQARKQELETELDQHFTRWEAGEGGLEAVEELLGRIRYLRNLTQPA